MEIAVTLQAASFDESASSTTPGMAELETKISSLTLPLTYVKPDMPEIGSPFEMIYSG